MQKKVGMNILPNDDFMDILSKFDMMSDADRSPGLVFVGEETTDNSEILALEYAEKYGADAVYFRKFDDGRPPIPQIYIYNFTENKKTDKELAELYKKLWNSGQVPIVFLFSKTEVKIFSCLKELKFDTRTGDISFSFFEKISLASKVQKELAKIKDFSAKKFDNGSFWNNPKYKDKFNLKESAYVKLLSELKRARKDIINKKILKEHTAQTLLVMSILVKYLEEREDENGDNVFPKGFFSSFSKGPDTFTAVLRKRGACLDLFDNLSGEDRFNGEIFSWKDKEDRVALKSADLTAFADFFMGQLDSGQFTFWKLYSFNDLPIELISNIYEDFLKSKEGVVYTPPVSGQFSHR